MALSADNADRDAPPDVRPGTASTADTSPAAERARFVVREAGPADLARVQTVLPEALGNTPPAHVFLATEAAAGALAGVAYFRVFADRVARFQVLVLPVFRRRGCGTVLLEAIREAAPRAGARSLLSGQSFEPGADDEATRAAAAFLQARGLTVEQDIPRYRCPLTAALAVLEPLYQRFAQESPQGQPARFVTADQVDPRDLAGFAVRHVGGFPEEVLARLQGQGRAYDLPTCMVALVDGAIAGCILAVTEGTVTITETRIVEAAHRKDGMLGLTMMYLAASACLPRGIDTIEFEHDTREPNTAKLARRFQATLVGRRQCFGCRFPETPGEPLPSATGGAVAPAPAGLEPQALPARPVETGPAQVPIRYTANFAEILAQLRISLAVTTYQAGKLVLLRADGRQISTHVQSFSRAAGLAVAGNRLAVGAEMAIWEYHNVPAAAPALPPAGRHDACFMPRSVQTTGEIEIHEMAWLGGGDSELWFVNTRFSCLCTRDPRYNFVPRWRPPFITGLAPEDRCHLNGLCTVPAAGENGTAAPRWYVTALGETDSQDGWRAGKQTGGILMDTGTNEVMVRGLWLPHSPRWHAGRLWLLESGTGTLGTVDRGAGRYEPVVELPGCVRGLAFRQRYAFVGLSRVRDTTLFGGIPLAERLRGERACGVWVVDIETGKIAAWLKFGDGVDEIFAVEVLGGTRFPGMLPAGHRLIADSFVLPDQALAAVPAGLRTGSRES